VPPRAVAERLTRAERRKRRGPGKRKRRTHLESCFGKFARCQPRAGSSSSSVLRIRFHGAVGTLPYRDLRHSICTVSLTKRPKTFG